MGNTLNETKSILINSYLKTIITNENYDFTHQTKWKLFEFLNENKLKIIDVVQHYEQAIEPLIIENLLENEKDFNNGCSELKGLKVECN